MNSLRSLLFGCTVLLALAPGRAAADPSAIFVGSSVGTVDAFSAAGAATTAIPASFSNPEGVAYNPVNNTLYVADASTFQIRTFNATTGAETTTSTGFANAAGLNNPYGLALNAGVLYAANNGTNTVTAYNAATGATLTAGFTSPTGLSHPRGLAVAGATLYIVNSTSNGTVGAYNLATGTALLTFSAITGLNLPVGVAIFGNDLFVANNGTNTVGEYNATTGAVINANFVTGVNGSYGLAVLGSQLLVGNAYGTTVGAYGIPAVATTGDTPTSANASFITGVEDPGFIAVVPEPSTRAMMGVGVVGAGVVALRRRRAFV